MDIVYDAEPILSFVQTIVDRTRHGGRQCTGLGADSSSHVPLKRARSTSQEKPQELTDEVEIALPAPVVSNSRAITAADRVAATLRNPFTCELLSKTSSKGFYESRYADVSLVSHGCQPVFDHPNPTMREVKRAVGKHCVYLRLGTSLVVTGVIIEAMENMCQISPDKGQNVSMEWVDASRLCYVPENLSELRKHVRDDIIKMLSDVANSGS
jgi:hypothetical protein